MVFFRIISTAAAMVTLASAVPVMHQIAMEPTPAPFVPGSGGGQSMVMETPAPFINPPVAQGAIGMETPAPFVATAPIGVMETPAPFMQTATTGAVSPIPSTATIPAETPMPPMTVDVLFTPVPAIVNLVPVTPSPVPVNPLVTPGPVSVDPVPVTPVPGSPIPAPASIPVSSVSPIPSVVPFAVPRAVTFQGSEPTPAVFASPEATGAVGQPPNPPAGAVLPEISPSVVSTAPVCFPASATVTLRDGSVKRMSEIQIGDSVAVGNGQYSDVFMFTHKLSQGNYEFVQLETSTGNILQLTAGHYIYLNGQLAAASTARIGDRVIVADKIASIISVKSVEDSGLYNPQTVQGDIVVNGVLASTYTTAVNPSIGHALLTPLRTVYERFGFSMKMLERGADLLANCMPDGKSVF